MEEVVAVIINSGCGGDDDGDGERDMMSDDGECDVWW